MIPSNVWERRLSPKGAKNSLVNTPPNWVEQSLSTLPLSLSGPAALLGSTLRRTEVTRCSLMLRAAVGGLRVGGVQVIVEMVLYTTPPWCGGKRS